MELTNSLVDLFKKPKKENRNLLKDLLFLNEPNQVRPQQDTPTVLKDFLTSFNRYTANQETAFDDGAPVSSTNSSSSLERQVERAIHQVLGKAPGRSPKSFMKALDDAFPTSTNGKQVAMTPVRSVVSLYSPEIDTSSMGGSSLIGQIPTQQASLYRQASVVATDALKVLGGLEPFVPEADKEPVEALRSLIQAQIRSLVDEFGRINNPRKERVEVYLENIKDQLKEFGKRALIDNLSLATTVEDEANATGFVLLQNYVATLENTWTLYLKQTIPEQPIVSRALSDRLARANILLPVIAQVNVDLEKAFDSVGFSESERISETARFSHLGVGEVESALEVNPPPDGGPTEGSTVSLAANEILTLLDGNEDPSDGNNDALKQFLPDITVYDLNEWIDRFATIEAPSVLSQSGQYGLNFVAEQADRLFWIVGAVVSYITTANYLMFSSPLEQFLLNERVIQVLNNLLIQLDALADLAN